MTRRSSALRLAAAMGLAALVALAPRESVAGDSVVRPDGGRDFELKTASGPVPAIWWYESEPNGPGAVLLATTAAGREEWVPVARHLRAREMNVIVVAVPALAAEGPDPLPLVAPASVAADAASYLVRNGKCDPARIGVAGAGVCALAAMEAVRKHPGKFRAAVLAGPDLSRFNASQIVPPQVDPAASRLLVMEHASAADPAVKTLAEAIPGCRRLVYDEAAPKGAPAAWGRSLAFVREMPLGERTVASFLDAGTGSRLDTVVLDGIVEDEAKDGGPWTRAVAIGTGKARIWAYRRGRRLVFGGFAPATAKALRLDVAGVDRDDGLPSVKKSEFFRRDLFDLRKGVVAWTAQVPIVPETEAQRKLDLPAAVRLVPCEGGVSFEGEWIGSATAISETGRHGDHWRVLAFLEDKVRAAEKGDPSGNLAPMPVVPSRY